MVPSSLANGEILIANYHGQYDVNTNIKAGIYGVVLNSNGTNTQSEVAVDDQGIIGNVFSEPTDLREDPTNASVLYVADSTAGAYRDGAIIKVNLSSSPSATVINQSQTDGNPSVLQWVTDSSGHTNLWVAYTGGNLYSGYLEEMSLSGQVLHVIDQNDFACVTGVARVPNDPNHLFVLDAGGDNQGGLGPATIYEVDINPNDQGFGSYTVLSGYDPSTGADKGGQELDVTKDTSSTDGLGNPADIALDTTGKSNLYVINQGNADDDGSVVQVQISSGTQTTPPTAEDNTMNNGPWNPGVGPYMDGITWDPPSLALHGVGVVVNDGVANYQISYGHISTVNPNIGQSSLKTYSNSGDTSGNDYIATCGGMIVYSTSGSQDVPTMLVNQAPTANAGLVPAANVPSSATVNTPVQVSPMPLSSGASPPPVAGADSYNTAEPSVLHRAPGSTSDNETFFAQWASTADSETFA